MTVNNAEDPSKPGVQEDVSVMKLVLTMCDQLKDVKALVENQTGTLGKKFTEEIARLNEHIDSKLTPLVQEIKELAEKLKKFEGKVYDLKKKKKHLCRCTVELCEIG
uniref:Uncharacterized protein n=1 Tax=Cacopsylla melanoneura TaxID=428564 RepID=A0A8D9ATY7_9HEMI